MFSIIVAVLFAIRIYSNSVHCYHSLSLPSASKYFVREGPVNDVASHWRRFVSDCSFRLLSDSWRLI